MVVVSPHFDDAAFSLGGSLAQWDRAVVVTAHGGPPASEAALSDWDAECGFASGREAHAVRMEEDRCLLYTSRCV